MSDTASHADFGYSARYPIGSGFDRIVSEMGVTGGSLDLGVSEQFSDHGQTLADQQPAAGEGLCLKS